MNIEEALKRRRIYRRELTTLLRLHGDVIIYYGSDEEGLDSTLKELISDSVCVENELRHVKFKCGKKQFIPTHDGEFLKIQKEHRHLFAGCSRWYNQGLDYLLKKARETAIPLNERLSLHRRRLVKLLYR